MKLLDLVKLMPDLKEAGDVSDFLDAGGRVADLEELAGKTAEWKPSAEEQPKTEREEDHSQAGILKRIAATAELFRTPAGDGYATIRVNGRVEHHPVESRAVELWLIYKFMEQEDRAPLGESLSQIVSTIKARALFSRVEIPVGIRVAPIRSSETLWPRFITSISTTRRARPSGCPRPAGRSWTIRR